VLRTLGLVCPSPSVSLRTEGAEFSVINRSLLPGILTRAVNRSWSHPCACCQQNAISLLLRPQLIPPQHLCKPNNATISPLTLSSAFWKRRSHNRKCLCGSVVRACEVRAQCPHLNHLHLASAWSPLKVTTKQLRGLSPRANYTDRASAASKLS
jgi:hypothetical protein